MSPEKLRKLIQEELFYREFYNKNSSLKEFWGKGEDEGVTLGADADVEFEWSQGGLTMWMIVDDKPVMSFSTQKEVRDLINDLEALLAGPMRTSP